MPLYLLPMHVPFDNSYKVAYAGNDEAYGGWAAYNAYKVEGDVRFGDSLHASVVINLGDYVIAQQNKSLDNKLFFTEYSHFYNYCGIYNSNSSLPSFNFYKFTGYFITRTEYISQNKYRLYLELDVIKALCWSGALYDFTYGTFSRIYRTHLNRFKKITNTNKYTYDYSGPFSTGVIVPEFQKRLNYSMDLTPTFSTDEGNNSVLESSFYTNIKYWVCYFIEPGTYGDVDTAHTISIPKTIYNGVEMPFGLICSPVYENDTTIISNGKFNETTGNYEPIKLFNQESINNIIKNFDLSPRILSIQVTPYPPFPTSTLENYTTQSEISFRTISQEGKIFTQIPYVIYNPNENTPVTCQPSKLVDGTDAAFVVRECQLHYSIKVKSPLYESVVFTNSEIQQQSNTLSPVLLHPNVLSVEINDSQGVSFQLDLIKSGMATEEYWNFTLTHVVFPDNVYYKIVPNYESTNSLISPLAKNLGDYGLVSRQNNMYPYSINQLEAYLANNKNYNEILNAQLRAQAFSSLNIIGTLARGFGAERQQKYQLEQLATAPINYSNIGGNPFFVEAASATFKPKLLFYKAYDYDLEQYLSDVYLNGYEVNLHNVPTAYMGSYNNFTYIQADIDFITLNKDYSNTYNYYTYDNAIVQKIRDIFSRGVRLYTNSSIELSKNATLSNRYQNYEKNL